MSLSKPKFGIVFFCIFLQFLNSEAQEKFVFKETFLEAESYFEHEEFEDALPLYIQLKEKAPQNFNLDYKIGRCYLNSPFNKKKSIEYLETAVKHISDVYKSGKYNEVNTPVDAYFYLGDAYRINNYLDKAIANYKIFRSRCIPALFDTALISKQINSCNLALKTKSDNKDIGKTNLSDLINTRYSEINPVVSANEDVIVYSSKLPFYDALFYSRKVDGKWTAPINLMPELQVDNDCSPVCLSVDGKELILYRSDNYLGDLYVSRFSNGKWSKIQKLNSNINTKYWESHATLSGDAKTMYFTSNRDGGYGGLDIYKSVRSDVNSNNWGPAVNLGPVINSPYNEETPFILSNDKRLYFSSFGHSTIGGYDVFYSDHNSDGSWSEPVNLGPSVNTTDDDLFFCPVLDGSVGYMSLYDPGGHGKFDIYRLKIYTPDKPREYTVSGSIIVPSGKHLGNDVYISVYDKTKMDTVFRKRINTLNFSFRVIPGQYELHISSSNFDPQQKNFTILWGDARTNLDLDIILNDKLPPLIGEINSAPTENNEIHYAPDILTENTETKAAVSNKNSDSAKKSETSIRDYDSIVPENKNLSPNDPNSKLSTGNTEILGENNEAAVKPGFWNRFLHSWKGMFSICAIPVVLFLILFWKKRKKENKEK